MVLTSMLYNAAGRSALSTRAVAFLGHRHIPASQHQLRSIVPHSTALFSSASTSQVRSGKKNHHASKRLFPEEINIIYDSKCNVCNLEIEFLRRRDAKLAKQRSPPQPKLKFTDLEDEQYDPTDPANGGVTYERGMASMHAVTSNGKVINGVPVFHMAYQQVDLGWLFAVTKITWIKRIADYVYTIFADYRTVITRGKSLESLVQAYQEKQALEAQQKAQDCEACNDIKSTSR